MSTHLVREKEKACIVGSTGFVALLLVQLLLNKGYVVNTTIRDSDHQKKVAHLKELKELGDLKIFRTYLTDEESFDAPVAGCDFVFHVATPIHFTSDDLENREGSYALSGDSGQEGLHFIRQEGPISPFKQISVSQHIQTNQTPIFNARVEDNNCL